MTEAVETGLWAVIENAEAHLKMRFERADTSADTDTTIGGCVDFEHHPLTGKPCGDDFLLCLQCTHAFATPRHLPRLIELRHQLEAIASTDGPDWTDFRAMAYGCLISLLDDRTLIAADEYRVADGGDHRCGPSRNYSAAEWEVHMSDPMADSMDFAFLGDMDTVDWAVVESGPVIVHQLRLKRPDLPMNKFSDGVWSLRPMGAPRGGELQTLRWLPGGGGVEQQFSFPAHLVNSFKRIVWLSINRPTPVSHLADTTARQWPAASSIAQRFGAFRHFGQYLGQEGGLLDSATLPATCSTPTPQICLLRKPDSAGHQWKMTWAESVP